jgi:hypothetical protein
LTKSKNVNRGGLDDFPDIRQLLHGKDKAVLAYLMVVYEKKHSMFFGESVDADQGCP